MRRALCLLMAMALMMATAAPAALAISAQEALFGDGTVPETEAPAPEAQPEGEANTEASADAGSNKGSSHRKGDAVDQGLSDTENTGRQRPVDDLPQSFIVYLLCFPEDRQRRAYLSGPGHTEGGIKCDVTQLLQLHGI